MILSFDNQRANSEKANGNKRRLGGPDKTVEADETVVGGRSKNRAYRDPAPKKAVFTLVERGGRARSRHVADVTAKTLGRSSERTQAARARSTLTRPRHPLSSGESSASITRSITRGASTLTRSATKP